MHRLWCNMSKRLIFLSLSADVVLLLFFETSCGRLHCVSEFHSLVKKDENDDLSQDAL